MADPAATDPGAPVPAPTTGPDVKPGWKTTEFWLHLAATVVGAVLASGLLPSSSKMMQACGLAATVLSVLGYSVNRTIVKNAAQVFLIGILLLGAGCKAIDAKVLKTWQDREAVLMQQLGAYVSADATKTPDAIAGEKTKIAAHLVQVQTDLRKVTLDDENALMSELLAYVAGDPKRDADSKQAKADSVQSHLRLFSDEIK